VADIGAIQRGGDRGAAGARGQAVDIAAGGEAAAHEAVATHRQAGALANDDESESDERAGGHCRLEAALLDGQARRGTGEDSHAQLNGGGAGRASERNDRHFDGEAAQGDLGRLDERDEPDGERREVRRVGLQGGGPTTAFQGQAGMLAGQHDGCGERIGAGEQGNPRPRPGQGVKHRLQPAARSDVVRPERQVATLAAWLLRHRHEGDTAVLQQRRAILLRRHESQIGDPLPWPVRRLRRLEIALRVDLHRGARPHGEAPERAQRDVRRQGR